MTNHATLLRQIRAEARPYIEQWLEIGEVFAGFRKLAADNDLDWGVIKALIKAEVQDEQDEEGGSKRVTKIIDKADCASAYADMLGLGGDEKNNFSSADLSPQSEINRRMTALWSAQLGKPLDQAIEEARADLPPHDEDGVIIEPASAPSDAEAGQGDGTSRPSSVASPTVSTRRNQDEGDAAQPEERGTRTHGSTDGGDHEDEVASIPDTKSSDNRQVLDVPSGAVPGSALESGAQVSEVAAIAPASAAIAPVEQSPSRDVAPGAPFPCEANGWAGLEPLPQFDRRRPAA